MRLFDSLYHSKWRPSRLKEGRQPSNTYVEEFIFSSERPKIYCSRYFSVVAVSRGEELSELFTVLLHLQEMTIDILTFESSKCTFSDRNNKYYQHKMPLKRQSKTRRSNNSLSSFWVNWIFTPNTTWQRIHNSLVRQTDHLERIESIFYFRKKTHFNNCNAKAFLYFCCKRWKKKSFFPSKSISDNGGQKNLGLCEKGLPSNCFIGLGP